MKKNVAVTVLVLAAFSAFAGGKKDSDIETLVMENSISEIDSPISPIVLPSPQTDNPGKGPHSRKPTIDGEKIGVKESWAYVMLDREKYFSTSMPITDLCYFSADINSYGELTSIPNPKRFSSYTGRIHLVVTCTGRALTHFSIDPNGKCRKGIIDAIVAASANYDGIQIDFENVGGRDRSNFMLFLKDIKKALPEGKIFSIALPARTKLLSDEIYDYAKISEIVDRILIMAYDEHWSGGSPGPVASMDWCKRVINYARTVIPKEKLIMGLPFYGRSWQNESYGSAWIFTSMERIMNQNNIQSVDRKDSIPYFEYDQTVHVTAYYDDAYSLVERCRMYQLYNVDKLGFWRVGQEDVSFWDWLEIK